MAAIFIAGGHVIDPGRFNGVADVLIDEGRVVAVGPRLKVPAGCTKIDAVGRLVLPGFVDLHVHFREPGFEYKESIQSGAAAAVAGGFTSVCCMPNTNPVNDNQAITELMLDRARAAGLANVFPIGAITNLNTPLERPIGASAVYSDVGFMLLGFLLETVAGRTLDTQ
ncbi:MAG TPA: amidohydrolase family protein, partial [Nitrospiraceae bacterium]|nr:amidohydrolase family protein [Nitrospiraceae bacterium]